MLCFRGISVQLLNVHLIAFNNCAKKYFSEMSYGLAKPQEPSEEDCCHSGCQNCVFDAYLKALEKWKKSPKDHSLLRFDVLSVSKFKPFKLDSVRKLTENTSLYSFKPALGEDPLLGYLPYQSGQHLSLKIDNAFLPKDFKSKSADGCNPTHVVRDFTITSLSHQMKDCTFDVIIKLYEGSFTSDYIKCLKLGDVTWWRGPYGSFRHVPSSYSHLIMFCMGTGIAPMIPIAKEIIENENDETIIHLHYSVKNSREIIFRDEIQKLSGFWNFHCNYYLSNECDASAKKYNEQFYYHKLNEDHVTRAILNHKSVYILICGREDFTKELQNILQGQNIDSCKYYLF